MAATHGKIRYLKPQADSTVVTDDGESRRARRGDIMQQHTMPIRSARGLHSEPTQQLRAQGFCCVPFHSSVAGELLQVQNSVIYRLDKQHENATSYR